MSQKDRDRLVVLYQVHEGQLTVSEGARRLHLGLRHMRRLLRRFEAEGDGVVVHALRGRSSNRRLPDGLRACALAKAKEEVYKDFGPTLLSEHLTRDPEIGFVHPSTLRLWMIENGQWEPTKRRASHRTRRERRAAFGELVLMDTSIHAWLENRSQEEIVLIALIDDATSRLYCRFFPRDTGAANRQLLVDYIECHGRMGAVYADRAGHFENHFNRKRRREEGKDEALTLIERALAALDIRLIHALSPQAKGRVERLFGTLQDRLIKEMRVASIGSMQEANRFLEEVFIPFWDERFTVMPVEPTDAHRPLAESIDILRLFAETEDRVVRNDFTLRYKNQHYQIERGDADPAMPGTRITIEERLDGTRRFRWRERYLEPTPLSGRAARNSGAGGSSTPAHPEIEPQDAGLTCQSDRKASEDAAEATEPTARTPKPRRDPPKPGPDHPWRRFPVRVGKGRFLPLTPVPVVASASLRPDTPAEQEVVSISP